MRLQVLVAVTHLLGAGHLARAAALASAFARAGHEVTLVSGGMPSRLISLQGLRFVALPPVRVEGTAFGRLLDEGGEPVSEARMQARRAGLIAALRDARPQVVVTELFPFGRRILAGEFETLLEAAEALEPRPLVLASLRDVLVAPSRPDRVEEAHRRFLARYDGALVHGDESFLPLGESWPLSPEIEKRMVYTGYVDEGADPPPRERGRGTTRSVVEGVGDGSVSDRTLHGEESLTPLAPSTASGGPPPRAVPGEDHPLLQNPEVLVSGGSSATALPLYRAALDAARLVSERPWRVLVGAGLPDAAFEALRAAAPPNAAVERARPDFRALLAGAAASVSQAGYNTTVDLLATGIPAVLVPFEEGRETEQRLRAERLARAGLAEVLATDHVSGEALAGAVKRAAERGATCHAVRLDGAEASVRIVEGMWAARGSSPAERGRRTARSAVEGPAGRRRIMPTGRGDDRRTACTASGRPPQPGAVGEDHPSPAPLPSRPDWSPLDDALRRRADLSCPLLLWWRDDDAARETPELRRLLELRARFGLPLALAAIPASLEPCLLEAVAGQPAVAALVHGLAHLDHAPEGEKRAELGPHRPLDALKADAAAGLILARAALGEGLLPVLVPPWNRIAPDLVPALPGLGYRGLSTFGPRPADPPPSLGVANAHLDPIDWRGSRGLADPAGLIARLAGFVAESGDEPIGLLTHHLVHDEAVWGFTEALLERLGTSSAVGYPSVGEVFFPSDQASQRERLRDSGVGLA